MGSFVCGINVVSWEESRRETDIVPKMCDSLIWGAYNGHGHARLSEKY